MVKLYDVLIRLPVGRCTSLNVSEVEVLAAISDATMQANNLTRVDEVDEELPLLAPRIYEVPEDDHTTPSLSRVKLHCAELPGYLILHAKYSEVGAPIHRLDICVAAFVHDHRNAIPFESSPFPPGSVVQRIGRFDVFVDGIIARIESHLIYAVLPARRPLRHVTNPLVDLPPLLNLSCVSFLSMADVKSCAGASKGCLSACRGQFRVRPPHLRRMPPPLRLSRNTTPGACLDEFDFGRYRSPGFFSRGGLVDTSTPQVDDGLGVSHRPLFLLDSTAEQGLHLIPREPFSFPRIRGEPRGYFNRPGPFELHN
mmetsp:Transcript_9221/g.15652  ORF Transcript_9221/g.15652 Transcript_9221/m.15652 type:complete len:312 (+) Transcript_9221:154-1089(+)